MVVGNNGQVYKPTRHKKGGATGAAAPNTNGTGSKGNRVFGPSSADGPALSLSMKIGGEQRSVEPADLLDDEFAGELHDACQKSGKLVIIWLDALLDYPDRERWMVLDFIAGLERPRLVVGENRYDDLFEAVIALMVGDVDMKRFKSGKVAALEAAVLLYSEALDGACARVVKRLRELGVKGIKVADVLRDARQFLKTLDSRPASGGSAEPRKIRVLFPDAPVSEGVVVPAGWQVSPDGLGRATGEEGGWGVSAPVFIVARGRDVHRGTELVTLSWLRDGRWQTAVVDRKVVANARTIVELAASGLPVTSNNARTLVQYLDEFEAANLQHLPVTRVSHKMGWQGEDGKDGFLWGRNLVTADRVYRPGDVEEGQQVRRKFRNSLETTGKQWYQISAA